MEADLMKNTAEPFFTIEPLYSLRQLVEQKAQRTPDEVCIRFRVGKTVEAITCGKFYADVRAIGNELLRFRIRGQHIAIIGENSYQWLVTFLAIVTTGNIAVLIPKDSSDVEVATMLFQTDTTMMIYSKSCQKAMEHCKALYGLKFLTYPMEKLYARIPTAQKTLSKGKNHYDSFTTDPEAPSAIFFTSGSTGFSKGVVLSQRNMCSNIVGTLQHFDVQSPVMSVLPFNHAFGLISVMLLPLWNGCEVFLCSKLSNFMREIAIAKPKTLGAVPLFVETFSKTIWRTAAKEGQEKKLRRGMALSDGMLKLGIDKRRDLFGAVLSKFGGQLECIISGGAPLDPKYVKEFRSLGIEVINGYGITECSPILVANRMSYKRDGSVGIPLPNVTLRIANPDSKGIGEVSVQSPGVMQGYYKDQQATDQVIDSEGWFYTGDLGYVDEDGFLFITGRKKSLIILANGENVSPEELEQYVSRIPEVNEVVVYASDNAITAEVFPEESELSPEQLKKKLEKEIQKLNAKLPNHKHIQKLIVRATEFEKTATRKIKRFKTGEKKEEDNMEDVAQI